MAEPKLQLVRDRALIEGGGVDNRGGPPDDGDMEARVKALEDALSTAKTDLAVIRSNYATKADIAEAKNSIIMWVVSAVLLAQLLPAILKKFGL
jgi:hypothetical protein